MNQARSWTGQIFKDSPMCARRVLLLTVLMLMLASRLPGQTGTDDYYSQPVACNDGTITFSVARAYRDLNFLSGYEWQVEAWYNVDPGQCKDIGPRKHYRNGGLFHKDSVTLLAFAFYDSTGTWGAVKLEPYRKWQPSNQQFCVRPDGAAYDRESPGGDPPRTCDGAQTGYQMIPASYEYTGPPGFNEGPWFNYDSKDNELHIELGPSNRAIPLGKQPSSGVAAQGSGGAVSSQSNSDASPSLCGKVSCWDYLVEGVRQAAAQSAKAAADEHQKQVQATAAAAEERQRQAQAAEAQRQAELAAAPPPPLAAPSPEPASPPADDPIGGGGFIAPPTSFNALLCLSADVANNSS
ncbi:MAG TPA: hypothetical protein VK747_00425, partial [Blastocatellia bacterium]|nr:hypothetical protein [Blastocatellia bacterium]